MTRLATGDPQATILQSFSTALHAAPIMSRVYDPDNVLSDTSARHMIDSLARLGLVITMAPAEAPRTTR